MPSIVSTRMVRDGPRVEAEVALGQIPRSRTLGDEAQRRLREGLMSGEMRPGQQITVRGLAQALGISLTPAREAMNRLAAEGVLAEGPNRTMLVPRLSVDQYRELLTIRLALEPMAASHATSRVTARDLAELRALQDDLRRAHAGGDYKRVLRCNERFHFSLYRRSEMPTLVQMLEALWLRIGPTLNFLHEAPAWDARWLGDTNHRKILSALSRRDADGVAEAVRTDLEDGGTKLLSILGHADSG